MANDSMRGSSKYGANNEWYVATLILRCRVGDADVGPWTCDEQVCVIRARSDDQAYVKAQRLGRGKEHSYENAYGEIVYWDFVGIANLEKPLSRTIRDGTEITSRLFEESEPSRLIRPRESLTVYWAQRNKHRKADEIITELEAAEER